MVKFLLETPRGQDHVHLFTVTSLVPSTGPERKVVLDKSLSRGCFWMGETETQIEGKQRETETHKERRKLVCGGRRRWSGEPAGPWRLYIFQPQTPWPLASEGAGCIWIWYPVGAASDRHFRKMNHSCVQSRFIGWLLCSNPQSHFLLLDRILLVRDRGGADCFFLSHCVTLGESWPRCRLPLMDPPPPATTQQHPLLLLPAPRPWAPGVLLPSQPSPTCHPPGPQGCPLGIARLQEKVFALPSVAFLLGLPREEAYVAPSFFL